MLVAVVKAQLVFDASSGLYDGSDSFVAGNLHAVGEGEEGIAGHHGAVQVEAEAFCLFDGLLQGVDAAGLPYAAGEELLAFGEDDGVRLRVLHDFVGKEQVVHLLRRGCLVGDRLQVGRSFYLQVAVLRQHSVEQRAELLFGQFYRLAHQYDTVFLFAQHLQGIHVIVGSDDDFEENLVDFLGRFPVDHGIGDEHASEGRHGVARQGIFPRLQHGGPRSQSAGIVVLQDGEGCFLEFVDEVDSRVDVQQVVVRDFLAVNLVEHLVQLSVEVALLVRVFAVAQGGGMVGRAAEGRALPAVEVVEDGRVVVRRHAEGFFGKPAPFFERGVGSAFHQDVAQRLVLCLRGHDDHVVVVLGSGAYERDAAYVDFLDDVGFGGSAGHGGLERIEVDNHEVYFGDFIFFNLLAVLLQGAAAQDASEYFGVQCLDASAQDGGIRGEVFHCLAGVAQ